MKLLRKSLAIVMCFALVAAGGINALADEPAQQTVNPTPSTVFINGEATAFEAYNIGGSNYFKLRDLAFVLNGTEKQFEIGYDNVTRAITLTSGEPYTPRGDEMAEGDGAPKTATPTPSTIYLDGTELDLIVYNIEGSNYFRLRDLMAALDIYVGFDDETRNITIDSSKSYGSSADAGGDAETDANSNDNADTFMSGLCFFFYQDESGQYIQDKFGSLFGMIIFPNDGWDILSVSDVSGITIYVNGVPNAVTSFTVEECTAHENEEIDFHYHINFGEDVVFDEFPAVYEYSVTVNGIESSVEQGRKFIIDEDRNYSWEM